MSNIILTVKRLPGVEFLSPVSESEITEAEQRLNLKFADEYVEYLMYYGAVWSDIIAISGLIEDKDYNVVDLTEKLRTVNPNVPLGFYAIEDVGVDGLVIWQDAAGVVYQSIPSVSPVRIFDCLSDFLIHQIDD